MAVEKTKKTYDKTSSKRATSHLDRLKDGGGTRLPVDTSGEDLKLLDELVLTGYAPSRAEAYRQAMRETHKKFMKKVAKSS